MFKEIISKLFGHLGSNSRLEPHYFIDSGYLKLGKDYIKNFKNGLAKYHKYSLWDIPKELMRAHSLLLGIISIMLKENNGRLIPEEKINEPTHKKFSLTASFVQGIYLCEQSILEALYLQAGNLIRQEFEILTLITEIHKNERKDGKPANVKNAPWKGGRHYGELSAIAHLSDIKIVDSIIHNHTASGGYLSTVPQYSEENTIKFYGFHTSLVLKIAMELESLYGEVYDYKLNEREREILDVAYSILIKHKIFKS